MLWLYDVGTECCLRFLIGSFLLDLTPARLTARLPGAQVGGLRREAAEAEAELEGARAQLALADPDGFFVAGSAAAHAAAAKAAATARLEEQRREARQRQRQAAVVAARPHPLTCFPSPQRFQLVR